MTSDSISASISSCTNFGRASFAPKYSCKLVMTGRHLLYDITLDGGWIFLSLSLMDKGDAPESLVHFADGRQGWQDLAQLISALERHNVKSLERPILIGNPDCPDGYAIE